jgi:hypothetical protein
MFNTLKIGVRFCLEKITRIVSAARVNDTFCMGTIASAKIAKTTKTKQQQLTACVPSKSKLANKWGTAVSLSSTEKMTAIKQTTTTTTAATTTTTTTTTHKQTNKMNITCS